MLAAVAKVKTALFKAFPFSILLSQLNTVIGRVRVSKLFAMKPIRV